MKKNFLKFVLATSLCLSIGLGSLGFGFGRQASAMGQGIMDYAAGKVDMSQMSSEEAQYEKFLAKLSEFDFNKLSDEDKKSYNELSESIKTYLTRKGMSLSNDEQAELTKLLWVLDSERASSELIQDLVKYMKIDKMDFSDMMISIFGIDISESESKLYELFMKVEDFSFEDLTEEQQKIYKNIEKAIMGNEEEIENSLGEDISKILCTVVYNLFDESMEIDAKTLTEIIYYLRLDHPTFLDLLGDYRGHFEKYISRNVLWFDYGVQVYHSIYDGVMNEDLDKAYEKFLQTGEVKKYIMGVIDASILDLDEDVEYIIETLYDMILIREADGEGLKFWVSKFNEYVKSGKSQKDAIVTIANSFMASDEFKKLVERFDLEF